MEACFSNLSKKGCSFANLSDPILQVQSSLKSSRFDTAIIMTSSFLNYNKSSNPFRGLVLPMKRRISFLKISTPSDNKSLNSDCPSGVPFKFVEWPRAWAGPGARKQLKINFGNPGEAFHRDVDLQVPESSESSNTLSG